MYPLRTLLWLPAVAAVLAGCVANNNQSRYEMGKQNFVEGNYRNSFGQLEPMAQRGDPDAQYAIGYMYFYGLGAIQDRNLAYQWMQAAAAQGQPQARQALAELNASNPGLNSTAPGDIQQGAFYVKNPPTVTSSPPDATATEQPATDLPKHAAWPPPRTTTTATPAATTPPVASPTAAPVPTPSPAPVPSSTASVTTPNANEVQQPTPVVKAEITLPLPMTGAENPPTTLTTVANADTHANYALQLMASKDNASLSQFVNSHHLQGKVQTYQTQKAGQSWYVLTYGHYQDAQSAHLAMQSLPSELQQLQPWVRNTAALSAVG